MVGPMSQLDGQDLATGSDAQALETVIESTELWSAPNSIVFNDPTCLGTGIIGDPTDINSYVCPHCNGTGKK